MPPSNPSFSSPSPRRNSSGQTSSQSDGGRSVHSPQPQGADAPARGAAGGLRLSNSELNRRSGDRRAAVASDAKAPGAKSEKIVKEPADRARAALLAKSIPAKSTRAKSMGAFVQGTDPLKTLAELRMFADVQEDDEAFAAAGANEADVRAEGFERAAAEDEDAEGPIYGPREVEGLMRGAAGETGTARETGEASAGDAGGKFGLDRRRGAGRRLSDFGRCAEEGELNAEQFLFVMAIEAFKRENGKSFPQWTDVLEVIRLLGYRKTMASELNVRAAEDWTEKGDAAANVRPKGWAGRKAA
ncbi:hypothetical protein BH11PLA1_BH11PLA1_21590 [soil metagenome]